MTRYQIERALRRDDLALRARNVDLLETIERGRERFHDADVVLVDATDRDEACVMQALEEFDHHDGFGPVWIYVPLAFGPVREAA